MNGLSYEKYCAKWLEKNGFHNITVTQASRDQGIDILATKKRKKYGFQCKYYESTVGNDAVQQAYTGAAYYGCDYACVITNSSFSKDAITLAEETDVLLYEKIDPDLDSHFQHFFRLSMTFFIFLSIAILIYESTVSAYQDSIVLAAAALFLFSFTAFFSKHSLYFNYASSLFSLISFLLFFTNTNFNGRIPQLLLLFLLFFHIYSDFQLLKKLRTKKLHDTIELQKEDEENEKENGILLASILSDEFHSKIQWISTKKENFQTTHTYRTTKDLSSDFALMEYSFNQYSRHLQTQKTYTFQKNSTKSFSLIIKNSHNSKKREI